MSEQVLDLFSNEQDAASALVSQRSSTLLKRRNFLSGVAATGAVLSAGALAGCSNDGPVVVPSIVPSVLDVLNFALNLEYLEASFYLYVTTGTGLSSTDMGSEAGTVTGGGQVAFVNPVVAMAASQLAKDEQQHVEFLRSTITGVGGVPVAMPNINLAAGGTVNSDASFLAAARQLEGVGTSAYIGGAQYLVPSTVALNYAARILHTEAQHSGLLRKLCLDLGVTSPAADALDIPPTAAQVFETSPTTGLNPVRTTSQVLQIVYGAPGAIGVSSGGFFPNGLNGAIITS